MRFGKIRTSGRTEKILTFKNHIMAQGYSSIIITSNIQRLGSAGDDRRSKRFYSNALLCVRFTWQMVKTRVTRLRRVEGRNACDQVRFFAFLLILSGSPNECWLHTCDACVSRIRKLELRAPLIARHNFIPFHGWLFKVITSVSNIINISTIKI